MHHIGHASMVSSAGAFSLLEIYSRAVGIQTDVSCRREGTINSIRSTSQLSSVIGNSHVFFFLVCVNCHKVGMYI